MEQFLKISVALCGILICAQGAKDLSPGTYKIQNAQDYLYLTIQGANASFAVVVGDNWQNFREQRWQAIKLSGSSGLHFVPEKYKSNNLLSYHKDVTRRFALPETWNMMEVQPTGSGKFLMQNLRTKLCLTTAGRRQVVVENACDKFRKAQHWMFTSL